MPGTVSQMYELSMPEFCCAIHSSMQVFDSLWAASVRGKSPNHGKEDVCSITAFQHTMNDFLHAQDGTPIQVVRGE